MSYDPDWFVISNYDNVNVINQISIIPKIGLKREYNNLETHLISNLHLSI